MRLIWRTLGVEKGKGGPVLIGERNKVALRVFERELKKGRKNFALFYMAAQIRGRDERLRKMMGIGRTGIEWLAAWTIDKPAAGRKEASTEGGRRSRWKSGRCFSRKKAA